jgi:hypothetical protein
MYAVGAGPDWTKSNLGIYRARVDCGTMSAGGFETRPYNQHIAADGRGGTMYAVGAGLKPAPTTNI